MKRGLELGSAILAASLIIGFGSRALANGTPDNETPASEGICNPLKEPGVTKGLYGLCVAYCEAQDIEGVDLGDPAAIEKANPAAKILGKYNQRKDPDDPAMPCVHNPCPCWTAEQLEAIDGSQGGLSCVVQDGFASINEGDATTGTGATASASNGTTTVTAVTCFILNEYESEPLLNTQNLSISTADICIAEIVDRCSALGVTPPG